MTRTVTILLGALLLLLLASVYLGVQNDRLSQAHLRASEEVSALKAERKALRETMQAREDSLARLRVRADFLSGRVEFYRTRAAILADLLNRPPAPFVGSDSALATALLRAYGHGGGSRPQP